MSPATRTHRTTPAPEPPAVAILNAAAAVAAVRGAHHLTQQRLRKTIISPTGHWNADADVRARLNAEWERHITASRRTRADLDAAVLAMLPLVTDLEPADLIEYADTLNQQDA